jgi:uncharacterized membrane protein
VCQLYSERTMTENLSAMSSDHPEFFKAPKEDTAAPLPGDEVTTDAPAVVRVPTNRGAAALIAVAGGALFALLYIAAAVLYNWASWSYGTGGGSPSAADFIQSHTVAFLATPVFWLTTIAFTVYFVLLALILHKGQWRSYVLGGLIVAILTYATAMGAGLFTVHAWTLTFTEAVNFLWRGIAFNPLVLVTVVLAREIPIWFGGWIALKGKKFRANS